MTQRTPVVIFLCIWTAYVVRGQYLAAKACTADSNESILDCEQLSSDSVRYKDGTYIGESTEWTGMKVKVTVKNGKIDALKILNVKGTPEYYQDVVLKMPRQIVKVGSLDVDNITGATLSCESLKKAVRQALGQADILQEVKTQE